MFDRLAEMEIELEKLEARLSEIYASGDQHAARDAGRRHAELKPIVDAYRAGNPKTATTPGIQYVSMVVFFSFALSFL